jgi:hypothetical protein
MAPPVVAIVPVKPAPGPVMVVPAAPPLIETLDAPVADNAELPPAAKMRDSVSMMTGAPPVIV